MSRKDNFNAFIGAVNSKHGKTIGVASNMVADDIPRLSTGSLSFDFALGGGVPIGRLSMFRGAESSGKTTAVLRIAALAQNLCANCLRPVDVEVVEIGEDPISGYIEYDAVGFCDCYQSGIFKPEPHFDEYSDRDKGTMRQIEVEDVDDKGKPRKKKISAYKHRMSQYSENSYSEFRVIFFDVEGTLDLDLAKSVGVDPRRLRVAKPSTAEECIDLYDELMRTGTVDLMIIDSIAAMTPSIEVEASTEDRQMAEQAKLINKFVRKVTSSVLDVDRDFGFQITQIWINQERVTMGGGWGDNTDTPGGNGQKFGSSLIAKMWPSKWEKEKFDADLKKDFQIEVGKEVKMNFKIIKNKTGPAQASGSYVMRVVGVRRGKIEEFKYIIDQARKYNLYREEEEGKKKFWYVGDEKFDKKGSALAKMEDPAVMFALKTELLKRMLKASKELEV